MPKSDTWTEVRRDVWMRGDTAIRRVRVLRGAMGWRAFFPDGRQFTADGLDEAKEYAERYVARLRA